MSRDTITYNEHSQSLTDSEGGIWWPTEEAREKILAADDPEAEARRLESQDATAGEWHF